MKTSVNLEMEYKEGAVVLPEAWIDLVADAGFDVVDFPLGDGSRSGLKEEQVLHAVEYLRKKGLEIGQAHLPYWEADKKLPGDGSFEALAETFFPVLFRKIELAGKIGCKIVVTHPIWRNTPEEALAINKQFIDALRPVVRKAGVRLALENLFGMEKQNGRYFIKDGHVGSAQEMLELAEYGEEDGFGLCLDTGHAMLLGNNPAELIRAWGHHLICLHVNNNPGLDYVDDFHMLPGALSWGEKADWKDIAIALKEVGYKGTYNMELVRPYAPSEDIWEPDLYRGFYRFAADIARHYADMASGHGN